MRVTRRFVGITILTLFLAVFIVVIVQQPWELYSAVGDHRPWAADEWDQAMNPDLLSERPSWGERQIQIDPFEDGIRLMYVDHPALSGSDGGWAAQVDAIRVGDGQVELANGGILRVTHFGSQFPNPNLEASKISSENGLRTWIGADGSDSPISNRTPLRFGGVNPGSPLYMVRLEGIGGDVAEIRNLQIGCSRVGILSKLPPIAPTVLKPASDGAFADWLETKFWHSIDPVIVADVVYDRSAAAKIRCKTGASVKIGETEIRLLDVRRGSVVLQNYTKMKGGRSRSIFSKEAGKAWFQSVTPISNPMMPFNRLLFDVRTKNGASAYLLDPSDAALLNGPIHSFRFEAEQGEVEEMEVRIAGHIDRIVIRLPRIQSPLDSPDGINNLFNLQTSIAPRHNSLVQLPCYPFDMTEQKWKTFFTGEKSEDRIVMCNNFMSIFTTINTTH
ncbi:MAG: hypothetical protein AAF585_18075 [Verrucomicrobiota bacterium]